MERFQEQKSFDIVSFYYRRRRALSATRRYLYHTYSMSVGRHIGTGGYGDVVELIRQEKSPVAGKLILEEAKSIGEEEHWPTLEHPNVLRLLDTIEIPRVNATLYITNILYSDIDAFISDGHLKDRRHSLDLVRRWLRDVLEGLNYLQKKGLSHLDIKTNNIFLTKNLKAVIADFSTLQPHQKPISKYGAPYSLMPPEAGNGKLVEGTSFDSWCIGTMALEIFTGDKIFSKASTSEECNWYENVYLKIYHSLQYDVFEKLVREAMPQDENLNRMSIELMRNFVYMHLKINPRERPLASKSLEHEFLKQGYYTVKPDIVWTHQASPDELRSLIQLHDTINNGHSYESLKRLELDLTPNMYTRSEVASIVRANICKYNQQETSVSERDIPTTSRTLTSYEAEHGLSLPPSQSSQPQFASERRKKSTSTEKVSTEEERRRKIEKMQRLVDYPNGYRPLLTKRDSNESDDKYANCSFEDLESIIQANMCKCQRQKRRVRERSILVKAKRLLCCKMKEKPDTHPSQSSLPQPASKSSKESLNAEEGTKGTERQPCLEQIRGWFSKKMVAACKLFCCINGPKK